jgi:hypothetical protein
MQVNSLPGKVAPFSFLTATGQPELRLVGDEKPVADVIHSSVRALIGNYFREAMDAIF